MLLRDTLDKVSVSSVKNRLGKYVSVEYAEEIATKYAEEYTILNPFWVVCNNCKFLKKRHTSEKKACTKEDSLLKDRTIPYDTSLSFGCTYFKKRS